MRVLILGSRETLTLQDPEYYEKYQEFVEKSLPKDSQHTVDVAFFDDLYIGIDNAEFIIRILPGKRNNVQEYDLVMIRGQRFRNYRDILKAISVYCKQHNVQVINDYRENRDGSKLTQTVQFYEAGLSIPSTVVLTPGLLADPDALELEFPLVMKATFAARGENNHLVRSLAEIAEFQAASPSLRFILQRAIPNDGDYRLLFIGDEAVLIHRTAQAGSHLNNTSQGGAAKLEPLEMLPTEIVEGARRYIRAHLMVTAGVDILADKHSGEHYFLEVNSQPQLTTGAFLDVKSELFAAYLRGLKN